MDGVMCEQDIRNAFMFLEVNDSIVIQCVSHKDLPYLRHDIIRLMGQPDRMRGTVLIYDRKEVVLVPMNVESKGFATDKVFYVGHADGFDEYLLEEELDIEDQGVFDYILSLGSTVNMSMVDLDKSLKDAGYSVVYNDKWFGHLE